MVQRRPFAFGTAGLVATTLAASSRAAPKAAGRPAFSRLVVLGDSLSDSGNAGRFSNGPVWVEHLARHLGLELRPSRLGGTNHAVGGARVAGLRPQAEAVLAQGGGRLDGRALYTVWAGGNDLLSLDPGPGAQAVVEAAAGTLADIVAELAAAGAVDIIVPNLPDIGHTPALRMAGPGLLATARRLTLAFDHALERNLDACATRRELRLWRLDVRALADRVMADPAAHGFREIARPCAGGDCDGVLFWDQIHPTTLAHARLAEAALALLGPGAP